MSKKLGDGRDYETAAKVLRAKHEGKSRTEIAAEIFANDEPDILKKRGKKAALATEAGRVKNIVKKSVGVFAKVGGIALAKRYEIELNCIQHAELRAAKTLQEYEEIDKNEYLHMVDPDGRGARAMTKDELFEAIDSAHAKAIAALSNTPAKTKP